MAKSADDAILAALQKAYDALPELIPLSGTKALFSAAQSANAERAVSEGYLVKRPGPVPKGKNKQAPILGVLTEKGIRRVTDTRSPKDALQALLPVVEVLGRESQPPNPETFRHELERATAACVRAIQEAFGELSQSVMRAVTPAGAPGVEPGAILGALRSALERVEVPVAKTAPEHAPSTPSALAARPSSAIKSEIISYIEAHARQTTVGCAFDALMNSLRVRHPDLSIGAFHDALRALHEAGEIRLGAWPTMLDDLPEPELALFHSSKVMYHALPAHR